MKYVIIQYLGQGYKVIIITLNFNLFEGLELFYT